jgi:hypothetical protein
LNKLTQSYIQRLGQIDILSTHHQMAQHLSH